MPSSLYTPLITVSTLGCAKGEINIFDSMFTSLDKVSEDILSKIFKNSSLALFQEP